MTLQAKILFEHLLRYAISFWAVHMSSSLWEVSTLWWYLRFLLSNAKKISYQNYVLFPISSVVGTIPAHSSPAPCRLLVCFVQVYYTSGSVPMSAINSFHQSPSPIRHPGVGISFLLCRCSFRTYKAFFVIIYNVCVSEHIQHEYILGVIKYAPSKRARSNRLYNWATAL